MLSGMDTKFTMTVGQLPSGKELLPTIEPGNHRDPFPGAVMRSLIIDRYVSTKIYSVCSPFFTGTVHSKCAKSVTLLDGEWVLLHAL